MLQRMPMRSDALCAHLQGSPPAVIKYARCNKSLISLRPGTKCNERQTGQKVHWSDCGYVIDAVTLEQARATAGQRLPWTTFHERGGPVSINQGQEVAWGRLTSHRTC